MNAIVRQQENTQVQTAASVRQNVNLIQQVMAEVMKKDVHFGTIPGTQKPTLYKPGAEVLCATFRLAPSYPIVEDLSRQGVSRYRVTCRLTHQASGVVMGDGMGACSSEEEKYKWRRPVCDKEFDVTPETMRRIKFQKGTGGKVFENKQVRTEPADVDNTILKMANKRAFIAAVLNVLAASDIFAQDLDELPAEMLDTGDEPQQQEPKQAAAKPPYPDDQFKAQLAGWKDMVVNKGTKPEAIINKVNTKYTLTNVQHDKITNIATLKLEGETQ